ncbi:MAG: GNAT family N-acetyltransferase [Candidatus Methanoperedens sp.]|nr:GNAT family N-acetyltransferase [Candidatus Methanoperedens sp.]
MNKNPQHGDLIIKELYNCRTKGGELRCHRINVNQENAGELIIRIPNQEKTLMIEEVFVKRGFRNSGLGSNLLRFGEATACELGFTSIGLRPFSTDSLISDHELKEWYRKRGYLPDGENMFKKTNRKNIEVIS